MNMIQLAVILYILLIGLAAAGSLRSYRLRREFDLPFIRTYHIFVLVSFAYGVMNFIGEVFGPAIFGHGSDSLVRAYMTVDLITIPLLGMIFFFLFLWIARLLGRKIPVWIKAVFGGVEFLFLTAFISMFLSYFVLGISKVQAWGFFIINGINFLALCAAVLILFFVVPEGGDPIRRRLARGLGTVYAASFLALGASLTLPWESFVRESEPGRIISSGMVFLVNFPALIYLQKSLKARFPLPAPAASTADGLAGFTRDFGVSDREMEIVQLVAHGLDNREIGKRLFISPKTVKNHMTSIYSKTGARNRVQLANLLNHPDNGPNT